MKRKSPYPTLLLLSIISLTIELLIRLRVEQVWLADHLTGRVCTYGYFLSDSIISNPIAWESFWSLEEVSNPTKNKIVERKRTEKERKGDKGEEEVAGKRETSRD